MYASICTLCTKLSLLHICSDKEIELSAVSQIHRNIEKYIFYIMRYDSQQYKFSGKEVYAIAE